MYQLVRILYRYARENYLQDQYDPEAFRQKKESFRCAERAYAKLKEEWPQQVAERLAILWDELELAYELDAEASFACGLSVGLALSRL
ncbi:MAG: hypothetical protein HFF09_06020 [Oscillospiraceae bacterium]|nr:hypothetical protein [Oscillospiraceae bacterium]